MMLSRRKTNTPDVAADLSGPVARALRKPVVKREGQPDRPAGPVADAVEALAAALQVLNQAAGTVREAARHVIAAASEPDLAARAILAERYDDARSEIERIAGTAPDAALPLIAPDAEKLSVPLRGAVYAVAPFPLSLEAHGLGLEPPSEGFETHAEIADTLRQVETAIERIGKASTVYAKDRAFLQRQLA